MGEGLQPKYSSTAEHSIAQDIIPSAIIFMANFYEVVENFIWKVSVAKTTTKNKISAPERIRQK